MKIKALFLILSLLILSVAATAIKPIKSPTQIKQEQEKQKKKNQGSKDSFGKSGHKNSSSVKINKLSYNSSSHELVYGSHRYKMVWVEGGSFMMGSDDSEAYSYEKPVHRESVSGFYIGQTEVPQWLWVTVMGRNPSEWKGDNLPVENVSWDDCQTFLRKLNSITGQRFRLPSESEWEYAARGGNRSKGYKYSGGKSIGSVAWYADNSGGRTHEVGLKVGNELELYDMTGNVWEWTSDHRSDDYYSPRSSSSLVFRGGSWSLAPGYCRVSFRNFYGSADRDSGLGFRIAL